MFGAAAVRNKKRKAANAAAAANAPRGPYIKPFGPRFDPSELPYFKYKRALAEAKELQENLSKAKRARAAAVARANGGTAGKAAAVAANGGDGGGGSGRPAAPNGLAAEMPLSAYSGEAAAGGPPQLAEALRALQACPPGGPNRLKVRKTHF